MKQPQYPTLNNFRYIYGKPRKQKSPSLVAYKTILGFEVFKVTNNKLAYVVYDKENEQYYNFEHNEERPETIETDLELVIKTYVI